MMYHKAFSVVNEGLSIKYGEEEGHCFAILVSAGKETSLLNPKDDNLNYIKIENKDNIKNMNIHNENLIKGAKINNKSPYAKCLRDKLITETYIQGFNIDISYILILVVGNINLNEQNLFII